MIGGSLTTLIAAVFSYKLRSRPLLVPLPPIVANGLIMGSMLHYVFGVPVALWACILGVAFGELIACYGIGYPLLKYLTKYPNIFK